MFEELLKKGCVFAGKFEGIDHEKYFIIIGISDNKIHVCSVYINSKIPKFILNNQNSLNLQINIKGSKYDFLRHDSFVACNSIQKYPSTDIKLCRYIGKIDDEDLDNVITTVINSGLLTEKEINTYFK
ncbi:MAG: hypothetical protein LBQ28_03245 [Prevotellaceae bacterium]|jgi:hypothetical protein|nr:hypothetical protein [Prevotellaceae bacterium]